MDKRHTKFDKCPNCGSEERLVGDLVKKEVESGALSPGSVGYLMIVPQVIKDMTKPRLTVSSAVGVIANIDACRKCGTLYTVEQIESDVMVAEQLPPTARFIPAQQAS